MKHEGSLRPTQPSPSLRRQFLSVSLAAASLSIGFYTCFGWYMSTVPKTSSLVILDFWLPVVELTGLCLTATAGVLIAARLSGSRFIWYASATVVVACIAAQYVYIFNLLPENNRIKVLSELLGCSSFNRWLRARFNRWLIVCIGISALSAVYACVLLAAGKAAKWYMTFRTRTQEPQNA